MEPADPAQWFFFDPRECEIVDAVLATVGASNRDEATVLRATLERLAVLARWLRDAPSISRATRPSSPRSQAAAEALIDALCDVPDYDFDLHIPTKAIVGQGYLVAKINFFKALSYAVTEVDGPRAFSERLQSEIAQSVYSKLAEELLIAILTDARGVRAVKLAASALLLRLWEDRLLTEVDDIAPFLESAWHARTRVRPVLGTMLGTHEIYRLFQEANDERLLDYFGSDDVPPDEIAAFEEFVFGLSFEGISRLRSHLAERQLAVVSVDDARKLLGTSEAAWPTDQEGSQALYTSYKRRRVKAAYRAMTGAPGPTKTAEEYVMTALLRTGFKG